LEEQLRRLEGSGAALRRLWHHDLAALVIDEDGCCRGGVLQDLREGTVAALPADAVIITSGMPAHIFGRRRNLGPPASGLIVAYEQGARTANWEFILFRPTAALSGRPPRALSSAALAEGARLWVPRRTDDRRPAPEIPEGDRWYLLEDLLPETRGLVPRHQVSLALFAAGGSRAETADRDRTLGYLDPTALAALGWARVEEALGRAAMDHLISLDPDAALTPFDVGIAMDGSLGGLRVDFAGGDDSNQRDHATSIPGLYAAGEAAALYHGANALEGNRLLAELHGGVLAAAAAAVYGRRSAPGSPAQTLLESCRKSEEDRLSEIPERSGKEDVFSLHEDLRALVRRHLGPVRTAADLKLLEQALAELAERAEGVGCVDSAAPSGFALAHARSLRGAIEIVRAAAQSARQRDESRGAHVRAEHFSRDDERFLRATVVHSTADGPAIEYEPVDTSLAEAQPSWPEAALTVPSGPRAGGVGSTR
jgi:succinate dehydrogenase / fumarate reductase flavoprotein subunit